MYLKKSYKKKIIQGAQMQSLLALLEQHRPVAGILKQAAQKMYNAWIKVFCDATPSGCVVIE